MAMPGQDRQKNPFGKLSGPKTLGPKGAKISGFKRMSGSGGKLGKSSGLRQGVARLRAKGALA